MGQRPARCERRSRRETDAGVPQPICGGNFKSSSQQERRFFHVRSLYSKATPEYQKIAASFAAPRPGSAVRSAARRPCPAVTPRCKRPWPVLCIVTPARPRPPTLRTTSRHWGLPLRVISAPGTLCCAQWRRGPRVRVPPLFGAGLPCGRAAERGPRAAEALLQYTVLGMNFKEHSYPRSPAWVYNRGGLIGPAVRRQVCAAQSGGRGRTVQCARRYRGYLYAPDMHQPAQRVANCWDNEDRFRFFLRPAHPAAGCALEEDLSFPCPRGAVRRYRRDSGPRVPPSKGTRLAPHPLEKGHGADLQSWTPA